MNLLNVFAAWVVIIALPLLLVKTNQNLVEIAENTRPRPDADCVLMSTAQAAERHTLIDDFEYDGPEYGCASRCHPEMK